MLNSSFEIHERLNEILLHLSSNFDILKKVKFMYSEKAIKFDEIFKFYWNY